MYLSSSELKILYLEPAAYFHGTYVKTQCEKLETIVLNRRLLYSLPVFCEVGHYSEHKKSWKIPTIFLSISTLKGSTGVRLILYLPLEEFALNKSHFNYRF